MLCLWQHPNLWCHSWCLPSVKTCRGITEKAVVTDPTCSKVSAPGPFCGRTNATTNILELHLIVHFWLYVQRLCDRSQQEDYLLLLNTTAVTGYTTRCANLIQDVNHCIMAYDSIWAAAVVSPWNRQWITPLLISAAGRQQTTHSEGGVCHLCISLSHHASLCLGAYHTACSRSKHDVWAFIIASI